ncbi:EcsC family protein [Candidatus Magnetomonas plexicatena]|uniref:EcsC family protein n=1 Tax=Candidatus Magnetomonas plexicatena TaxID=2552947 RepID=UPI001101DF4B|nr:EcsC family protein [Nitrospirales bacterium LBB_01]
MAELNEGMLMKALDYCYERSVNGLPGLDTAEEFARNYSCGSGSIESKAKRLVNIQTAKAGVSGFVTGIGGIITLPVAIPANLGSILYLQIRMIAAVAVMGGHDIRTDEIKSLVYLCLCGSASANIMKDLGLLITNRPMVSAVKGISRMTITKINQGVGFRLLTRFGQGGLVNIVKAAPLVGGIIGGIVDAITTKATGKFAINYFLRNS